MAGEKNKHSIWALPLSLLALITSVQQNYHNNQLVVTPVGVLGISSDGDDRMEPKVKTQKKRKGFQQNPKKSHADLVALKSSRKGWCCNPKKKIGNLYDSKTRLFVLCSQNYAARVLPILFNTPKKPLLKSSYPKKSRNRKFQTHKKSFDHPRHLKSRGTPPPPPWGGNAKRNVGLYCCD